jgi:hypothetical protein
MQGSELLYGMPPMPPSRLCKDRRLFEKRRRYTAQQVFDWMPELGGFSLKKNTLRELENQAISIRPWCR